MTLPQRSISASNEEWEFAREVAHQARIALRLLVRQGMKTEAERLILELHLDAEAIRQTVTARLEKE